MSNVLNKLLSQFRYSHPAIIREYKILNEYDNEEEATKNLVKLLGNKATEKDILKDYSKKRVF